MQVQNVINERIEKITIINKTNNGVVYHNLVNSMSNIQEFKEVYICLEKFSCILNRPVNIGGANYDTSHIVIKLENALKTSHQNDNSMVINSKILDTSLYKTIFDEGGNTFVVHNIENNNDTWMKINSIEQLNNLKFSFEVINFTGANISYIPLSNINFVMTLKIKLV